MSQHVPMSPRARTAADIIIVVFDGRIYGVDVLLHSVVHPFPIVPNRL